ncbi:MAG TPA: Hsp20/alpha crystallin family protein [Candidatus Polarisedimenticolaceae bacterium]
MSNTFGPLFEVARIQSEINRLFDNLIDLGSKPEDAAAGTWTPIVDVVETEDHLLVRVELPGVPGDRVQVSAHAGNVIVRGEKPRPQPPQSPRFHVAERAFGRFRRVIPLGTPVNTHKAEAVLADGFLRISFPKVPNRRGEEVPIEVQSA